MNSFRLLISGCRSDRFAAGLAGTSGGDVAHAYDEFDRGIEEAERWLKTLEMLLGWPRRPAYCALKATLEVVREHLPPDVSAHFASELPAPLAGVYLSATGCGRSGREFGEAVSERLATSGPFDGQVAGRCALQVIRSRIGLTEFRKILAYLPKHVRELWLEDHVCADACHRKTIRLLPSATLAA
jgi:uncharacterized protein (DUF2267 family)